MKFLSKFIILALLFNVVSAPIERALATDPVSPTPAPSTEIGFSYYVDNSTGKSYKFLRYRYGPDPAAYVQFLLKNSGTYLYFSISSNIPDQVVGGPQSPVRDWDIWQIEGGINPKMFLITNGSSGVVSNFCIRQADKDDTSHGLFGGWYNYYSSDNYPGAELVTLNDDVKYFCNRFFVNQTTDSGSSHPGRGPITAEGWQSQNTGGKGDYNYIASELINKINAGGSAGVAITSNSRGAPLPANDLACAAYKITPLIPDESKFNEFLDSIKTTLEEEKTTSPNGYSYIMRYFDNAEKINNLKRSLLEHDKNSFNRFYGSPPPDYPYVPLTSHESDSLTSSYQQVINSEPFIEWDGKETAGVVSNVLGIIGIAAALAAVGLGVAAGAGGAAATTGGAVQLTLPGMEGFAAGTGAAATTTATVTTTATAAGNTLVTIARAGAVFKMIWKGALTAWQVAQKLANIAIASVLVYMGVSWGISSWAAKVEAHKSTWSPVVNWMDSSEYATSRDKYIPALTKFVLDSTYANANNNYNKCLAEKNDPYALVNSDIEEQVNSYMAAAFGQVASYENAEDGGCPSVNITNLGQTIAGALCSVLYLINEGLWSIVTPIFNWSIEILSG